VGLQCGLQERSDALVFGVDVPVAAQDGQFDEAQRGAYHWVLAQTIEVADGDIVQTVRQHAPVWRERG